MDRCPPRLQSNQVLGLLLATEDTPRGGRALQIENCKLKIANWRALDRSPNLQFSICNFQFAMPFLHPRSPLWLSTCDSRRSRRRPYRTMLSGGSRVPLDKRREYQP